MKYTFIFTVATLLLLSCNNAQKRNDTQGDSIAQEQIDSVQKNDLQEPNIDAKNIVMIRNFYTAYAEIWTDVRTTNFNTFTIKRDSLATIYCTDKLRLDAKNADLGYDLLTDNWPIDINSLETMKIIKDSTKNECYTVLYKANIYPNDEPVML
jgi:hypothetical protein